jgi:hypothetical protein
MPDPVVTGPQDGARRRPLLRTMLGDVLRRTRLEQGRTLADVARAARVSMPYLSEVERGRKEASSEVLAAICDALRLELAELLTATGQELSGGGYGDAAIVRLDSVRGADAPVRPGGAGDAFCLLAA